MSLRTDLVERLKQLHYDLPVEVTVGTMDNWRHFSQELGYEVVSYRRFVRSFDIDDLMTELATEIGFDVLHMHKRGFDTKYAIYFHEVPVPNYGYMISYAKASA